MPQTNKEFVDTLDIRPEDGFLAVAVRRAAAWQLGKDVVDLEMETVGEPDFYLPWDGKQFGFRLETELGIVVPFGESDFENNLSQFFHECPDWFRGPAIKMPMKFWTELAVKRFLGPIRDKITCPEDWTFFETEKQFDRIEAGCYTIFICGVPAFLFTIPAVLGWHYGHYDALILFGILALFFWTSVLIFSFRLFRCMFPSPPPPLLQLFGTMTFYDNTLQFADDNLSEGTVQILPGDYRFFLMCLKDYTPSAAVLTTFPDPPSHSEFESAENVQQFEIVIDGGIISIMELNDSSPTGWVQPISNCFFVTPSKVVHRLQQREDRTVSGIKLLLTYDDGSYKVFVAKTPTDCSIMVELQTPPAE